MSASNRMTKALRVVSIALGPRASVRQALILSLLTGQKYVDQPSLLSRLQRSIQGAGSQAAISQSLKRLHSAGLVVYHLDPYDARRRHVKLSKRAGVLFAAVS